MKLNIEKIEFKNLFSYGNQWQSFEPNGISFITGLNLNTDRRNFTGKSNLLKIFPFALYGKVEDLTKDRIVNWKNRKGGECFVYINKGDDKYVIHRGIKPDILEVSKNGTTLPSPPNKRDFQKQIEEEIFYGIDFQTFMNVVYADTNNSSSILKMSKPDKRKFLENIFDLGYYTKLHAKANKKINSINQNMQLSQQSISQTEDRIQDSKLDLEKYKREFGGISDSSTTLKNKERSLKLSIDAASKATKEINRLRGFVEQLRKEKADYEKDIFKLKIKAKDLSKFIIKDADKIDIESIEKQIKEKKEASEKNSELLESITAKVNSFKDDLIEARAEMKAKISTTKSKITDLKKETKDIQSKLDNKLEDDICPTCFSAVDHDKIEDHYKAEKHNANKRLSTYEENLIGLEAQFSEIEDAITEKRKLEDKLSDVIDVGLNISQQIEKLKKNLEEEKDKASKIEKSNKYKKVIRKMLDFKKAKEISAEKTDENKELYESDIKGYEETLAKHDKLASEVDQLEKAVKQEDKERIRIKDWITETENKIKELEKSVQDTVKSISKSKNIKDYLECIRVICGDDRAKKYAISNKVPLLNQRTNYYLNKAEVNFYIKLDNWLEVDIRGPGIKNAVYANLSGAEKVSLDRSLQFAFNDINRLQSPTHYDLMVLDEILDSSVDSIGLQNIVNIVKAKQHKDQSNILIVSHKQSFDELEDLVDNFYRVEFDGKYSHIKKV